MASKGGMATGIEVARISVKVSPDTRRFRSELMAQLADIEKSAKMTVKVDAKTDTRKAEAALAKASVDRKVNIKVDTDKPYKKILKLRAELKGFVRGLSGKAGTVDIDVDKPIGKLARLRAELAGFKRGLLGKAGVVDIDVQVNKDKLEQNVVEATKSAAKSAKKAAAESKKDEDEIDWGILGGGGKNSYPSFGSGINPAGYGVILAGIIALAAPLLGLITTALLTLPGLISLLLTPIGALTLGIEGFKEAASTLSEPFKELKDVMSAEVKEQFTPVFESMRDIFPVLKSALPSVTQGLADMLQGVTDAVVDPQNLTMIEETVRGIGAAFTSAAPGVRDFTSGLIELARDFTTDALPGIVEWFNGAGASFKEWVSGLDLKTAFAGLGDVLQVILGLLGDLAKAGMEWIQDPSKVNDFKDGLQSVADVLKSIADLSATLNDLFKNMLPDLSWEGFKKDFTEPFTSEDAGWRDIFNKPKEPVSGGVDGGTKAQVDGVTKSIEAAGAAADANRPKVDQLLGVGSAAGVPLDTTAMAAESQPKIEPPNTEEASLKLQEYNQLVDETAAKVKASLSESMGSGDAVPPPDLSAFKAGLDQLPGLASQAMANVAVSFANGIQGIVAALDAGSQAILAIVTAWPAMITAALSAMNAIGFAAGMQLAAGMAAGIAAGQSYVITAAVGMAMAAKAGAEGALGIKSPSRVFMKIGGYTAEGFGVGMEKGFGPVLAQAKDMAWKISEAFANGTDPTDVISGMGGKEVSRVGKALALEAKRLEVQAKALTYQSKITGDESLKARAEELRMQKEGIVLQKEMLDLTQDYADLSGEGKFSESPLGEAVQTLMNMPQDFLGAMGQQVMSDFGIQGGGALSSIADYGMGLANNFVFNVSNVDEAMAVHRNQVNKQGMGVVGR
jgi:hypothetical protein